MYHDVIIAPMMSDTYVYRFREISLRNIGRIAKSIGLMLEFDSERIDLWKQIFLQHLLVNSLHLHRFSMNSPVEFRTFRCNNNPNHGTSWFISLQMCSNTFKNVLLGAAVVVKSCMDLSLIPFSQFSLTTELEDSSLLSSSSSFLVDFS